MKPQSSKERHQSNSCRPYGGLGVFSEIAVLQIFRSSGVGVDWRRAQIHLNDSESTCYFDPPHRSAAAYFLSCPLSSRFNMICSGVTLEVTPSFGTSTLLIQSSALSITLRKLSSVQFLWKCAPVKPKPRPPSGRS